MVRISCDGAVHRVEVMNGDQKLSRIFVEESQDRFAAVHHDQRDVMDKHFFNSLLQEGIGGRGRYGLNELLNDMMNVDLLDERQATHLNTAYAAFPHSGHD